MSEIHHHHHHHDHGIDHTRPSAFALAIVLNLLFVVVEALFGFRADSLALLADAGHNFGDVIGLFASLAALLLAKRQPTPRYTYGLRSATILAALINTLLLLIAVFAIAWEAMQRLGSPQQVNGILVSAVAGLGVVINVGTALLLMRGREHDLNQRSAFVHMVGDALIALGVVVGGILVWRTGWLWLDPVISLAISVVILIGTWHLFRASFQLALHAVPENVDTTAIMAYLTSRPAVAAVHDLHVWGMSTTENALTAHLVTPGGHPGDAFLHEVTEELEHHFHIHHATLQIELNDFAHACPLVEEKAACAHG